MDIIVLGTHKYFWALRAFADLFNKHFDKVPITHYGDIECSNLPVNFTSKRVPCYTEGSWPWDHWFGNGLRSVLQECESYVIFFLPDHWICKPVRKNDVRYLLRYMKHNSDVVRGNLTAGTCLDGYGELVKGKKRVVQVRPDDVHCALFGGTTFAPAIWNRDRLLEIVEPHWDLWDVEKLGTEKMVREWPRWRSVGVRPGPVVRAHGLLHGRPKVAGVEGLKEDDVATVRKCLPSGWRIEP